MRKKGTTIFLLVMLCLSGTTQVPLTDQFYLDLDELHHHLAKAPLLDGVSGQGVTSVKILLPTPKGTHHSFKVWQDPILSTDLQAEYPNYQTYSLQSEETSLSGRLMLSPGGLDAVIISGEQVMFIESVEAASTLHRVYYWKLGSNYLSFAIDEGARNWTERQSLKLAVLVDPEYAVYHQDDLQRAVFSSVNGVNAFLELNQQVRLDLHYFSSQERNQVLTCRTEGFQGRTAESIKLFGDLIASGELDLADFDLGHLFSGRGFGGNALPSVAGKDVYYDWNEDQIFDGPAKAGGGTGAAQPKGANWWGNLCKGINRQIGSVNLALNVQKTAQVREETPGNLSADMENLEHFRVTMKHYSGPRAMGEADFPHLSCLPFDYENRLDRGLQAISTLASIPIPSVQLSSTHGIVWPLYLYRSDEVAVRAWLQGWRL